MDGPKTIHIGKITAVNIRWNTTADSQIVAWFDLVLPGRIEVRGWSFVLGRRGLFISVPSRKVKGAWQDFVSLPPGLKDDLLATFREAGKDFVEEPVSNPKSKEAWLPPVRSSKSQAKEDRYRVWKSQRFSS